MSSKASILLIGATGYIGGAVLTRLLAHPNAFDFEITALVRSSEKAAKLKTLGIRVVVGSYSDLDRIESLASKSDVVIAIADSDNVEAAEAILRGLKAAHEKSGKVPVLIHTSGTGVLADDARGMYAYETVYSDMNPEQLETLPETQIHRNVDLKIVEADKQGYVRTHIILPSTVYGLASGLLVEMGISNHHSVQLPALIKACLHRGQAGVSGEGKNVWPNVHIDDVADLYIILLDRILSGTSPIPGHGREGFYFAENGEHKMYDVCKAIAEVLVDLGKGRSAEPDTFTYEEEICYFGKPSLGTNSRCTAVRSRALGWKPTKTTKDMLASIRPEIEALIQISKCT